MDAINKAFEILDVFLKTENELTISELSKLSNISPSTAHRITNILVKRGYIYQSCKRGKYSLSPIKLVDFAGVIKKKLKIRNIALPYMQELSQISSEAVMLSLRHGYSVFNVEVVNISRLMNVTLDTSSTFSLYSTGLGKLFLAYMSETEFQEFINSIILKPRTPNTITNVDKLKSQLRKIRQEGIAYDNEEHELGVRVVAGPIKDSDDNVVAGIGIIGPSTGLSKQRLVELTPVVKEYALKISQAMGHIPSSPDLL